VIKSDGKITKKISRNSLNRCYSPAGYVFLERVKVEMDLDKMIFKGKYLTSDDIFFNN